MRSLVSIVLLAVVPVLAIQNTPHDTATITVLRPGRVFDGNAMHEGQHLSQPSDD